MGGTRRGFGVKRRKTKTDKFKGIFGVVGRKQFSEIKKRLGLKKGSATRHRSIQGAVLKSVG